MNKLIVGNWKMHKGVAETKEHIRRLKPFVARYKAGVWLAVPFTDISAAAEVAHGSSIAIGAQNMSDHIEGAQTGEISVSMIKEAGASFVILGHSERRRIFHEDNGMINRKVKLALKSNLKVILCIGETDEQHKSEKTDQIICEQLKNCLENVTPDEFKRLIIAYEPVWAIGTKQPATPEIVEKIHLLCKTYVANDWGLSLDEIRLLYGGSVNSTNAKDFLGLKYVDGLLVGGASLDVHSFVEIIR